MTVVGRVDSLWRYPVKSMRGETLEEAFIGFAGVFGDRVYAFRSSAAPAGFPYLTGREREAMLLYRPAFRHPDRMAKPANLAEAEAMSPGITPAYPATEDLALDVETPSGERLDIADPRLLDLLGEGLADAPRLALRQSDRAMTDCRPISLISAQTTRQVGEEVGAAVDQRRFRANVHADLHEAAGFAEDAFVGRTLRIGAKVTLAVLDRDPRCKMITLDPDTARASPEVLRVVNRSHGNKAGVYCAVLTEGTIRPGDEIVLAAAV